MAHRTFSGIDHLLGHKESFNRYQETERIPRNLPDHKGTTAIVVLEHAQISGDPTTRY